MGCPRQPVEKRPDPEGSRQAAKCSIDKYKDSGGKGAESCRFVCGAMTAGANGGLGCSPCAGGAWQIRRNHGSKWIYPRWTSGHCDQKWGKVEGRHFFGAAFLRFPTSLCPGAVFSIIYL